MERVESLSHPGIQEPLRKVAEDYGVLHETIRRTVNAARKQ
ncbi:MAG TPA: hypothetical protein VFV38_38985 [Ktedonobacteraceae bacterium]|nr:hypothetical protein [Ktedonobacteraceae bacterium]